MPKLAGRRIRRVALIGAAVALLSSCATVVNGNPTVAQARDAHLGVKGTDNGSFDTIAQNALSDIMGFWRGEYPKLAGGSSLPPLSGGLYSVDGLKVAVTGKLAGPVRQNACAKRNKSFVVDNAAFCLADDSIAWDRSPTHLFGRLADKYGPFVVALIFAHEFGHAISYRLGVFHQQLPTIDTESQADCAAGAWAASALAGNAPHFRDVTPDKLDAALEGFLDGRDQTPNSPADVSHGNGFDRLSALADGIDRGASYCFSPGYFDSRTFTERPFTDPRDYNAGGNQPLSAVVAGSNNLFVEDLNRFWTTAAKSVGKTFSPVRIAEASHPKCGDTSAAFGYCPDDNTVYHDTAFARSAYHSLPAVQIDSSNGNVTLLDHQPADFSLGVLFSIAWGMAVRHQLFARGLGGKAALTAAVCYSGSYAKDINVEAATDGQKITLSPADLDEATSSMLDEVGRKKAFGARGTTGLNRIQDFVQGYRDGLSSC